MRLKNPRNKVAIGPAFGDPSCLGSVFSRALLLVLLAALLALARLAIDPTARAVFAQPILSDDEVLMSVAMTWQPPPVWLDARPNKSFARSHVPGAHNLSVEEAANFEEQLFALDKEGAFDGSRPVVAYCSSAGCQLSRDVAARLRERYPSLKVYILFGGWR